MKREYEKVKSAIAEIIYRIMYRTNYQPLSEEVKVISTSINEANKRALAIALKEKSKDFGLGKYCVVTFENTVSAEDSRLNIKALNLAHNEEKPLTIASTRTK